MPLDKPWTAPDALALDGQTLETWKLANSSTPGARFLFDLATESVFAAEPRDLSLLHALFYYHSGNGVDQPHQHRRRRAGLALRRRLPARVDPDGRAPRQARGPQRARCGASPTPGAGVTVATDAGTWRGKAVIVAMAPTLAGRIDYDPPLPAPRDQLTQRVPQGSVIKYEAVYPKPFWRADGAQRLRQQRPLAGPPHLRQLPAQRYARRAAGVRRPDRTPAG